MLGRMTELSDEIRALFEGPNYGHLATLTPDGSPASVAVWVGLEDGRPVFFTQPQSVKAKNLARDGRLAFSLVDFEHPYRTGRIRGHVTRTLDGDEALSIIDRLSHKYTGQPFPMRSGRVYVIEVESQSFMELPFEHTPPSEPA
jgi:PPOX class probable F420-dependent enzyme